MSPRRKIILKCSLAALLCAGASGFGQQLFWGTGGAGGNGTWDTTTANWWDGTNNVAWSTGATAVFGGTPGSVGTVFSGLTVGGMTFNVPGYVLPEGNSGWIHVSGDMIVTTNADATLGMTMSGTSSTATLVKEGAATLTVNGTNFMDVVKVNAGTYRTDDLFFSDVVLADAPGVRVSLIDADASFGSLSGGGNSGGIVQPDSTTTSVNLSIFSAGSLFPGVPFAGVLKDNGAAKLTLSFIIGGGQTLTNANTYTGATSVASGRLTLSGQGSIANTSAISISTAASIRLDNTTVPLSNRLGFGKAVTLSSANLELIGHATTATSETLGALTFYGGSALAVTQPANADTTLTIASITRGSGGTLDISGSGRVVITGATPDPSQIFAPFVTVGNEYAAIAADHHVVPLANYAGLNAGAATDNVKVSGAGTVTLLANGTRNTLNLQNSDAAEARIDLAGNQLTIASGSILTSGTGPLAISGGTLSSGTAELLLQTRANTTISATIANGPSALGLLKRGAGTLTLTGVNTYTGNTTIGEGILAVSSDSALGLGGSVLFNGGTLQALASFTSGRTLGTGAVIDTNGFTVTLNGTLPSIVRKIGAGTLSLPKLPGNVSLEGGAAAIGVSTSGIVTMSTATSLDITGRLTRLDPTGNVRLDIGGGRPSSLLLDNLGSGSFSRTAKLTLGFDLGASGSDYVYLPGTSTSSPSGTLSLSYLFDFNDLGGALTGVDYPLLSLPLLPIGGTSFPSYTRPALSNLSLSPEALAEGWRGTFKVTSDQVLVNFTAVPEPGSAALLGFSALLLAGRRPRRSRG